MEPSPRYRRGGVRFGAAARRLPTVTTAPRRHLTADTARFSFEEPVVARAYALSFAPTDGRP